MAAAHGKNSVIKVSNGTVLTNITAYADEVQFPQQAAADETTTFGAGSKTFIAGLGDSKVTIKGKYDGAAAAIDVILSGALAAQQNGTLASLPYEFGPAGSATGNPKYTGNFIMTDYEITSPVAGVVTWQMVGQGTGPSVRTTY